MDVKIENKDILLNSVGEPHYIESFDELCQRVNIACSVKKGSFLYDRGLGYSETELDISDSRICETLSMIFKEATIDIPYTDLRVSRVYEKDGENYAEIEITSGIDIVTTEVKLSGEL